MQSSVRNRNGSAWVLVTLCAEFFRLSKEDQLLHLVQSIVQSLEIPCIVSPLFFAKLTLRSSKKQRIANGEIVFAVLVYLFQHSCHTRLFAVGESTARKFSFA
jgi:hypothetical protein